MINAIDHIVLTVRDIERSAQFYERVLKLERIVFAGGRVALGFGHQKINLQTLGQETRNNAGIGSGDICLITEWTTEQLLAHLAAENVPVVEGPVEKSGAMGPIVSIYIRDPDMNLVEISQYRTKG